MKLTNEDPKMLAEDKKLRGIEVARRADAIFIPLPRELWTGGGGSCSCGHCDGSGFYDTLAIPRVPQGMGRDTTWMVHFPELQAGPMACREVTAKDAAAQPAKMTRR